MEQVAAAKRSLEELGQSWGHELKETSAHTSSTSEGAHGNEKVVDPVAITALVLSIPSAVLAVTDIADRIQKRRRAKELIEHAEQLATQQVTITLISQSGSPDLATLAPDQLLDLLAADDPST